MKNNFTIVDVPIELIKPDSAQPRKYFDEESINNLAESIRKDGLINAIEIDKNHTIITGERRYRAIKKLGYVTIPCKIVDIADENEKFRRQVAENIHQHSMSDFDIANSLLKLSGKLKVSDINMTHLAQEIGMSRSWVREKLNLFSLTPAMQESIKNGLPIAYARALVTADDKYRSIIEKRIIAGEFVNREVAREMAFALKNYPQYADKILEIDYKGVGYIAVIDMFNKMIPGYTHTPLADAFDKSLEVPKELIKNIDDLSRLLKYYSKKRIGSYHAQHIQLNLEQLQTVINDWLNN